MVSFGGLQQARRQRDTHLVGATHNAPLKVSRQGQELSGANIDPNVLVRNELATVVVDVVASPVKVGIGDGDAVSSSIGVAPGEDRHRVARLVLGGVCIGGDVADVASSDEVAFGVALEGRLWDGHDGGDIRGADVARVDRDAESIIARNQAGWRGGRRAQENGEGGECVLDHF